jgi:hypothetical protein
MEESMKKPAPTGEWVTVDSSNIAQVKYEPTLGFLWVQFHASADDGTGLYAYQLVPEEVFQALVAAKSVGKYFYANIAKKFSVMKEIK